MPPCLKYMAIVFACCAMLWPGVGPAHAQWGEVFIAGRGGSTDGFSLNVDTMVLPDGTPVVGYVDNEQALTPTLGFIEDGVPRYVSSPSNNEFARFEMDRFGIISYAGSGWPITNFGTDNGSATTIVAEQREENINLFNNNTPIDLALNQAGVPTLVGRASFDTNSYTLMSFDIPRGAWTTRTLSSSVAVRPFAEANTLAAYTDDNRLILATANNSQLEVAVEQNNGSYLYYTRQDAAGTGVSLASFGDETAFAYQSNGSTVGVLSNSVLTFEALPSNSAIAPGSLVYAPDGTLSFVYADATTNEITLAQRTAPGTWTAESLGVTTSDASYLSLAFASDGTPYIGVGSEDGVSLFSTAFPSFVLGDMDGSGTLDFDDINPFVQALIDAPGYASAFPELDPNEIGDFNQDGSLTNLDINGFVLALTGSQSITLEGLRGVPEPNSLAALLICSWMIRRRRTPA
ncbi:MAG: hypothetical protein AAGI37_18085 [Planctomycetota bacterium]